MIKQFKQMLGLAATISSCFSALFAAADTTTVYIPGIDEVGGTVRCDTVVLGIAGNLSGYRAPLASCNVLYINLVQSGSTVGANAAATGPAAAVTAPPLLVAAAGGLPACVKDLWITGDASDVHTAFGAAARALPTPAPGTTIHFLLSEAANSAHARWFQSALPASCRVVVEPLSADPRLNTVMPPATGMIILGAPVAPAAGFSALLNCPIYRHPSIAASRAYDKALLTMAEATIFSASVKGISLAGAFAATFNDSSCIIDPAANAARAGFTVEPGKTLTLFASHENLPTVASTLVGGETPGQIVLATSAPVLPTLVPALKLTH